MSIDSVARGLAVQALALITGKSSGGISSSANPAITLTTAAYNLKGQLQLDDNGSIVVGSIPTLNGPAITVSKSITSINNIYGFNESSAVNYNTAAYAAYNVATNFVGTGNFNHLVALQDVSSFTTTGTSNFHWGFYSGVTVANGTLINNAGVQIADPALVTGGQITNNVAVYIPLQTAGSYNWGVRQIGATNPSKGPWNQFDGNCGYGGIVLPGIAIHLASTSVLGWDNGGTADTKLTRSASSQTPITTAILNANVPLILGTYTVATLPTPSAALAGARAWVTDQLTSLPAWGGTLTGNGNLACPCWCTGSAWVAG